MHIMHVTDSLAIGGKERMLVEIANATAADGYQVSVCITRAATDLASQLRAEIPTYVLHRRRRFEWRAMQRLSTIVRDQRVDVLHVHGRAPFSFLAFMRQIGLLHTPILLHDHFGMIELENTVPLWFQGWGRRWVGHYVGVYSKLAEWASKSGLPASKVSVIGNALNLSRVQSQPAHDIRRELGLPVDLLLGVVVGNLRREKGTDFLIDAISRSRSRDRSKVLVLGKDADPDYARECKAKCARFNLHETILFLGQRLDAIELLKGADFALLPSQSESGPLVLIEFMACGLPFVATRVGDVSRQVDELGIPTFVDPSSVDDFAAALDELLSLSAEERKRRGEAGRRIALANFDLAGTMPRWYVLYNDLMDSRKHR